MHIEKGGGGFHNISSFSKDARPDDCLFSSINIPENHIQLSSELKEKKQRNKKIQ